MMSKQFSKGDVTIYNRDVKELYGEWKKPTVIVSDGAYGTDSFPSDPSNPDGLDNWYEPHVKAWSDRATPQTTLWFWNTEIGWAEVHPLLKEYGWEYRGANIWNKGIQHISGNSNTKRLRKFPQVTEVCVHYVKKAEFSVNGKTASMQEWLRNEWDRAGLTLHEANEACGVANAASRKYLTKDDLWYFPPPEAFVNLAEYANNHGQEDGKPYFTIDGEVPSKDEWKKMRAKFDCPTGVTNVWDVPPLHSSERIKAKETNGYSHLNQKPLNLIYRVLEASSDDEDVVWEPFGGLCTTAVACLHLNRQCESAEIVDRFYNEASKRLETTDARAGPDNPQRELGTY